MSDASYDATRVNLARPQILNTVTTTGLGVVQQPLSVWQRIIGYGAVRKSLLLVIIALSWEVYGRWLGNSLLFPTFGETSAAFVSGIASGELVRSTWFSVTLLLQGYVIGLLFAAAFTALASATQIGSDLLETLTSMFNPLPSIALLPLAMIWFGLGNPSIIFVLIHAVLWSVALNTHAGFRAVSPTWRMVGQNYGLSKVGYIARILIPGAFPSILTGLKIGWAFAWRTLIAAELVFGASGGDGGLGWYIFQHKNQLDIPNVFAGLLTVIIFGLLVENVVFRLIERSTVQRWGMQT
jgi:NitT/TauT family transport system permease protein